MQKLYASNKQEVNKFHKCYKSIYNIIKIEIMALSLGM